MEDGASTSTGQPECFKKRDAKTRGQHFVDRVNAVEKRCHKLLLHNFDLKKAIAYPEGLPPLETSTHTFHLRQTLKYFEKITVKLISELESSKTRESKQREDTLKQQILKLNEIESFMENINMSIHKRAEKFAECRKRLDFNCPDVFDGKNAPSTLGLNVNTTPNLHLKAKRFVRCRGQLKFNDADVLNKKNAPSTSRLTSDTSKVGQLLREPKVFITETDNAMVKAHEVKMEKNEKPRNGPVTRLQLKKKKKLL